MNIKITLSTTVALICGSFSSLYATAVPWVGTLDSSHAIVVPAGKILLIQHMNDGGTTNTVYTNLTISGSATGGIGSGTFSKQISCAVGPIGYSSYTNTTLMLGPGMTLSMVNSGSITVFGTAMDTGDYFASASPAIQTLTTNGSQLAAAVDSRTTVPTTTTGQSSTDLQTWSSIDVAVGRSQSNPRISWITTPIDAPQKFLRATVTQKSLTSFTD